MEPVPRSSERTLRLALVALALLVLLAVVAFASRSGVTHTTSGAPTPGYINWAVSVFLVIFVLMIPWAAYAYLLQLRDYAERSVGVSFQSRVLRSLGGLFLILALGALVLYLKRHHALFFAHNGGQVQTGGLHPHVKPSEADRYKPTFQYPVLWVTLVLLALGGGWFWWDRTHRASTTPWSAPTMAEDVAASIDDAIDDLDAEPDARRAVIAAYARMENVLARHGLRRQPSETPIEYLRRILLGLTSRADAVTRLTGLFEQAKFSSHEIDASMKQDAIAALRTIRDDLQTAPA